MDDAQLTLAASSDDAELTPPDPFGATLPPVTVALVAHNPGAWFGEVLRSLRTQDYSQLDVVVIDAASDEPLAPKVLEVLPEATVVPIVANRGFAANANLLLDHGQLGRYVLICHDDVALASDCVRRLVEEAVRSNAGVVGPKLLDWNDPNRILHVGLAADKTGAVSDLAEPGEYDQEQHDAVRDVFAVPGAATLIRTDLFEALGGFDQAMIAHGEDLDLCWRAHVLGARVLINPAATARHREDLSSRVRNHDRERYRRRHQIRAMLSNYGWFHTIRVLPQALFASFCGALIALLQGRLRDIGDLAGAWFWNIRTLPSLLRRRRRLSQLRQVDDAEVRALQLPGFEGVHSWRRARADRRDALEAGGSSTQATRASKQRARLIQIAVLTWLSVAIVVLFGSRGLIFDRLPTVGEFANFPDQPGPLLAEWSTTWRSTGMGTEAPSSLLHFFLGFGGIAFFGQMGLLRLVVTVGMIGVGAVGMYRFLHPFGSIEAQLAGMLLYVAAPVPYNAIAAGSWSALVVYGALPWVARRLAIAARLAPFGERDASRTRAVGDTVVVALVLAAAALVTPLIGLALVVVTAGWLAGSFATQRPRNSRRLVVTSAFALIVAFVLLLPGSLAVFSSTAEWSSFARGGSTSEVLPLADAIRFASGPHGGSVLGWALPVVPALAVVLAGGRRLLWAARSWFVTVTAVVLAWLAAHPESSFVLGDTETLLAPAAFGFAVAGAMAAIAFRVDLRRHRFGWRQLVPIAAGVAIVLPGLAGLQGSVDGRWGAPDNGYENVFSFFDEKAPAHARTFWIGSSDVLPVQGWSYGDGLTWSITHARSPSILDRPIGNPDPVALEVREVFRSTLNGASSRLGERLALHGIRYVAVVEADAPAPFTTVTAPAPASMQERLGEQLDLVRVEVRDGVTLFENRAYVPMVSMFEPQSDLTAAAATGARVDNAYVLALPEVRSLRTYRGPVAPGELWVSLASADQWQVRADGTTVPGAEVGSLGTLRTIAAPADLELVHSNDPLRMIAGLIQLGGWAVVLTLLILGRRRRS